MIDSISQLALFRDTTDDELFWLVDHSQGRQLARGEYFMREGDAAREFYVVLDGELQILRTINGQEIVVGTTPRGVMGGEVWLLTGTTDTVTARALMPTRLMVFDYANFLQIFSHVPTAGAQILRTAAERLQGFARLVNQQEKLAALGKLSAGLAHELNNPASAAQRATAILQETVAEFTGQTLKLCGSGLSEEQLDALIAFQQQVAQTARTALPFSTLEQADREDELWEWLNDHQVADSSDLAATFVNAHIEQAALEALSEEWPSTAVNDALVWLQAGLNLSGLLDEIGQSTQRVSQLVAAIKAYTYMDHGEKVEVDIHRDLENTLLVLKHKLKTLTVVRQFDPTLPKVMGRGGELNQVWTNLIDNAIDALAGKGTITLITRCENSFVMVEIADDGPGIPPEVLPHIFEPFFTTKGVGAGTGMGLEISYRIIEQHNGTIEVRSQPGETRFIVRLPASP